MKAIIIISCVGLKHRDGFCGQDKNRFFRTKKTSFPSSLHLLRLNTLRSLLSSFTFNDCISLLLLYWIELRLLNLKPAIFSRLSIELDCRALSAWLERVSDQPVAQREHLNILEGDLIANYGEMVHALGLMLGWDFIWGHITLFEVK